MYKSQQTLLKNMHEVSTKLNGLTIASGKTKF